VSEFCEFISSFVALDIEVAWNPHKSYAGNTVVMGFHSDLGRF